MQITQVEVVSFELQLKQQVQMANLSPIDRVHPIFIRMETRNGRNAWGCGVAHPVLTGENPADALRVCQAAADKVPDLHPTNLEYSLTELNPVIKIFWQPDVLLTWRFMICWEWRLACHSIAFWVGIAIASKPPQPFRFHPCRKVWREHRSMPRMVFVC